MNVMAGVEVFSVVSSCCILLKRIALFDLQLHVPELALSYCDRVYESGLQQHSAKSYGNIYLTLLQIYLNPTKTTKNFEKKITNLVTSQSPGIPKVGSGTPAKVKGGRFKKIAEIEGAEDTRLSPSGTDSGRSDGDTEDTAEEGGSAIMLDQVLDLLSKRWDRIHGAQALKLLPRDTKLQVNEPSKHDGIHELDENVSLFLIKGLK